MSVSDECACGEVVCVPTFADKHACDCVLVWGVGAVELNGATVHVDEFGVGGGEVFIEVFAKCFCPGLIAESGASFGLRQEHGEVCGEACRAAEHVGVLAEGIE